MMLGEKGSACCCCGPCRGFPALDGSRRFYKYATIYDYDCCYFGDCRAENGTDGMIKVQSTGCGLGVVVLATGNYQNTRRGDVCIDCRGIYQAGTLIIASNSLTSQYLTCGNYFDSSPGVVNPTKVTLVKNGSCCNSLGDKLYLELTEEVTDGSCNSVGACCGWKNSGNTGQVDDKKTCRLCHECECDTGKGEVWHGAGSVCKPNPCCCEGFQAFDGSAKYYRYAKYIDNDECYFTGDQNDGYFIVRWTGGNSQANTPTCTNAGTVIESVGGMRDYYQVNRCGLSVPTSHVNDAQANSATYTSVAVNPGCNNALGD